MTVGILSAGSAKAQEYAFNFTGIVSDIYSANGQFQETPNPPSSIEAGDSVSISFDLSPSAFSLQSYDSDSPNIHLYWGYVTNLEVSVGPFILNVPAGSQSFADPQLWNNEPITGQPTDSFSTGVVQALSNQVSPFNVGAGTVNFVFDLNAYDPTAMARNNDLITEITPLSGFSELGASAAFINASTYQQTNSEIFNLQASDQLISAAPEPSSWLLIIAGVGVAGTLLRRRARIATADVSAVSGM